MEWKIRPAHGYRYMGYMGIGTWVMGGEQYWNGQPTGWANVEDKDSKRTLLTAFDMGVRIIDTADQYGEGHAERVIAEATSESGIDRDEFVICTKAGMVCDPETGDIAGITNDPQLITQSIEASLKRLNADCLDLVLYHINGHPIENSEGVFEAFSRAYDVGKISGFGWSTDDPRAAEHFATLDGYCAVEHDLNLFSPALEMLKTCEVHGLWSLNRQPLAMGLLSGKHQKGKSHIASNDIRASGFEWLKYFVNEGRPNEEFLEIIDYLRALLTYDGRTLAQGALGWCLAQSSQTIPLPGCRTPKQAAENFGTLDYGSIAPEVVDQVNAILSPAEVIE